MFDTYASKVIRQQTAKTTTTDEPDVQIREALPVIESPQSSNRSRPALHRLRVKWFRFLFARKRDGAHSRANQVKFRKRFPTVPMENPAKSPSQIRPQAKPEIADALFRQAFEIERLDSVR